MPSLRTWSWICAGSFGALLAIGWGGSILQATGAIRDAGAFKIPIIVAMVSLLVVFAVSAIPVMVKLVLGFQRAVGNENVPAVKAALKRENVFIWAIWGLILAGSAVAIPAAILNGAFGDRPANAVDAASTGPSQGVLVARPGMTFAETARQSTLKLDIDARAPITSAVGASAVFDFRIPGTGISFRNCRYYFLSPYTNYTGRIETVNVGLSPHTISRAEAEAANADLRARLAADGWLTGHEEYRDEQDRSLHGGLSRGPEGRTWLKNDMVLDIENRRMDDAAPGEDAKTAGKWIQFIDLWPRKDYPYVDRLVFSPPTRSGQ